ncbi:MAG: HD domain-containing protein [Acidobacteriaceae bacterium]|nr:HD domain-containing protein [Acidobacteriaceae bacterium]
MKSHYVDSLVPNEVVTAQFLVLSKEIRQKKTGEAYLTLHLADRTGEIEAKMWDNVAEIMETFDRDDFIKVKGLLQLYQSRSQFTIHRLRRLEDHEVDFADYFPCADRDSEEMLADLRAIIAGLPNPFLRRLLEAVFSDPNLAATYKIAPAAKTIHHACRGGLIDHVLSLCTLAKLTAPHYPEVDLSLLLTGVILHDIGKVEELTYARSFNYSADGQLLGHIILGLRLISSKFDQVPDFPAKLRVLVEHMIISHHGELEFGSPKVPAFPEALLLHHLDNLDSKMNAMRNALKRDRLATGDFTGYIPSLERVLLKKDRFLAAHEPTSPVKPGGAPAASLTTAAAPPAPQTPAAPAPAAPSAAPAPGLPVPPPQQAPPKQEIRPEARAALPERKGEQKPAPTLFGEKLQAVLESLK